MRHYANDIGEIANSIAKHEADRVYKENGNAEEWFKVLDNTYTEALNELASTGEV